MENKFAFLSLAIACFLATSVIGQFDTIDQGNYVFSVSHNQLPWAQAVNACEAIGQKLVSVENPTKDDLLVQLFVEQRENNVTLRGNSWISATEVREGVWHWASLNKPLYHSRWFMDGQPDDKENLNCVYMAASAMLYWRDANCSASMYFICEGPRQQKVHETLLDGYGLNQ